MNELTLILQEAAAAVESTYFLLPIHGGAPKRRERVYCYELYHQMRLRWPLGAHHSLNGELDKRGHPQRNEPSAPDFLVHVPGSWEHNYAIIEVKPCSASADGLRKDMERLSSFMNGWRYQRAILLTYGGPPERCMRRARHASQHVQQFATIELWHHPEPGLPAIHVDTIQCDRAAA